MYDALSTAETVTPVVLHQLQLLVLPVESVQEHAQLRRNARIIKNDMVQHF